MSTSNSSPSPASESPTITPYSSNPVTPEKEPLKRYSISSESLEGNESSTSSLKDDRLERSKRSSSSSIGSFTAHQLSLMSFKKNPNRRSSTLSDQIKKTDPFFNPERESSPTVKNNQIPMAYRSPPTLPSRDDSPQRRRLSGSPYPPPQGQGGRGSTDSISSEHNRRSIGSTSVSESIVDISSRILPPPVGSSLQPPRGLAHLQAHVQQVYNSSRGRTISEHGPKRPKVEIPPTRLPQNQPVLLQGRGQLPVRADLPSLRGALSAKVFTGVFSVASGGSGGGGAVQGCSTGSGGLSPGESRFGVLNKTGPRKRADDTQLAVLIQAFEESAYPSTEEREILAKKLGMTSRSVQIWFQNRRRSVKVEQQSTIQRAEVGGKMPNKNHR